MGAVFAAAARAPMTAAIIMFELTDEYRIILPLLFAISIATGVANLLTRDTIYTLKLRRRGIDVTRKDVPDLMRLIPVSEAMRPAPRGLVRSLPIREAVPRFTGEHRDALPVVDEDGNYRGTVTSRQVEQAMRENAMTTPVGNFVLDTPKVRAHETLEQALALLVDHDLQELPVLSADGNRIAGWLTHRDVLRAYYERSRNGGADGRSPIPRRA
jgi:CIC family chloride channel protein